MMNKPPTRMTRRQLSLSSLVAGGSMLAGAGRRARAAAKTDIVIERDRPGQPHKGKVLLAVQAHSDDIPLTSAGVVAKLVAEGHKGYLLRTTNDDMGDDPKYGMDGTVGEHVTRNEQDNAAVARELGLDGGVINLNYNNHRMNSASWVELVARFVYIIRAFKVDTIVCWDPWGRYEENPDHHITGRALENACWMAGRKYDYPEHILAGLPVHEVTERYWYARHPDLQDYDRVVDVGSYVDKIVEANRANVAKGPGGHAGSKLRDALAKRGQGLALLGNDDVTADRNYIRQFVLERWTEMGKKHGLRYAEAYRYFGPRLKPRVDAVQEYIKRNAKPIPVSKTR